MGKNKVSLIRYKAIDNCLRNTGRRYYIEDLVDACNDAIFDHDPSMEPVKKRTIQYDLNFMESEAGYAAPIERVGDGKRRKFYRYEDSRFSIQNQPLNEVEAEQLASALNVLTRIQGIPQYDWVNDLTFKLKNEFALKDSQHSIMAMDTNEYLTGRNYLGQLYDSILTRKPINILYRSFNLDEDQQIEFHPYFLKEYNNRWFVFGKNTDYENLINLALDRILQITPATVSIDDSARVDFEGYFDDIIGVTRNNLPVEKVLIRVAKSQVKYIVTKPWHSSFTIVDKDPDNFLFYINVISNYELESLILSYGEYVEVIEPKYLRDKLKARAELLSANYKENMN